MRLKDFMTRDVEVVHPDTTLQEAARRMKALDVGSLPVSDNGRLVGMLTDRDITVRATAEGLDPKTSRVRESMTEEVVTAFEDQEAAEAAEIMRASQIRRLVVLGRDERLVGIISLGDLAVDTGEAKMAGQVLEDVSAAAKPQR